MTQRQVTGRPIQALIVAAGMGTRLRGLAVSKPLAKVAGVPLIESAMDSAAQAGVTEFVVVTGYEGDRLEAFLAKLAKRRHLSIKTVRNDQWTLSNGLSVIAAAPVLRDQFVLMMSDHLFEPGLLRDLLAAPKLPGGVVLAVDRRMDNPLVDLEDVTRVLTDDAGRILNIGKLIDTYNAFDPGLFCASKGLVRAIADDHAAGGAGSISAGMLRLAPLGLARVHDIGERFWLDVDDPVAHGHAERLRA